MGAAGAAIATVISQAASVVVSAIYLARSGFLFDFKFSSFKIHIEKLKMILKIGIPTGIQQVITSVSFMTMTTLVNTYGVSAAAAAGVAGRFNGFAIMPAMAISNSVAMMCAQNFGARIIDRARRTRNIGLMISFCVSLSVFFISQTFPGEIMRIFTSDTEVIDIGIVYMRAFSYDYLVVPLTFNLMGFVNGSGHTLVTAICSILSAVGFRIPAALLLSNTFSMGITGIGLAAPIASLSASIILLCYIASGAYKKSRIITDYQSIELQ
jgi:putative MATE family efflux protein